MSRWVDGRPRMWYGWTDMGPIQIPTLPQYMVLTDRTTGTKWLLTFDLTGVSTPDGYGRVALTNTLPSDTSNTHTFVAYEEPYFPNKAGLVRLYVDTVAGKVRLGAETLATPQDGFPVDDHGQQQLMARAGNSTSLRKIVPDSTARVGFGWDVVTA